MLISDNDNPIFFDTPHWKRHHLRNSLQKEGRQKELFHAIVICVMEILPLQFFRLFCLKLIAKKSNKGYPGTYDTYSQTHL